MDTVFGIPSSSIVTIFFCTLTLRNYSSLKTKAWQRVAALVYQPATSKRSTEAACLGWHTPLSGRLVFCVLYSCSRICILPVTSANRSLSCYGAQRFEHEFDFMRRPASGDEGCQNLPKIAALPVIGG